MLRVKKILALLSAVLLAAATQPNNISKARNLPSLKIVWHWEGQVDHLDLLNNKIYVQDENTVTSLDALQQRQQNRK